MKYKNEKKSSNIDAKSAIVGARNRRENPSMGMLILWTLLGLGVAEGTPIKNITEISCNTSNKNVQLITNMEDWKNINNPNKSIFCVSPGDYAANQKMIEITASGTKEKPRYIVLNNSNNLHPVKLSRTELAKYRLKFVGANYWIVDRQAEWENKVETSFIELRNSSNNIFSRGLLQDTANGIALFDKSNNNTIQEHHIEKTQWSVSHKVFSDLAAIGLNGWNHNDSIKNTKIIHNEIINYVDAIQLVRYRGAFDTHAKINFEGTQIIDNAMYVTSVMYSDGQGNSKNDGEFSFTENAIDLKGGSLNTSNPIVISGNYMWGYKTSDRSNTNLNDAGAVIVTHNDVPNVVIDNNTLSNSHYGILSGGAMKGRSPLSNTKITNNKFYNLKYNAIASEGDRVHKRSGIQNITIKDNIFHKCGKKAYTLKLYNTKNVKVEKNIFSENMKTMYIPEAAAKESTNLNIKNNHFYNSSSSIIASYVQNDGGIIENNVYTIIPKIKHTTGIFK